MLKLRDATRDDVPAVLGMVRELAAFERAPDAVTSTEDDVLRHAFAADPLVRIVMADWDGGPAGFALWFRNYSTWQGRAGLYLEDLYVKPAYRRRGIARALLVHLAQVAVREGYGRFQWQVLDWNEGAIKLYEALGAQRMSDWLTMRVEGEAIARLAAL
jgi:GNAT superfamily N-acetyltransferase